jgi:hypothetical protein|tara:strand:- start:859 stop:1566 length:708 start_codon:yes stop_codon:yes gene_type:complete
MSEENPQTPAPEDKSSSVPLKKETTRVTLKASEGAAPPPPAPAAPKPAAPAQATQPLAPAPAAAQPSAAKTVPLSPAPAASSPATQSAPPQATVKLQPSQPGAASTPGGVAAPLSTGKLSASLDDDGEESFLNPLAWACVVLALAVLLIEAASSPDLSQQDPKNPDSKSWGIPHDDYDRRYNPQVDNKENKEAKAFRFAKKDQTGIAPPANLFPGTYKRSLPTKEYDAYKGEQNN